MRKRVASCVAFCLPMPLLRGGHLLGTMLVLGAGPLSASGTGSEPDWARLHPEELKVCVPVVLGNNPFQGGRSFAASRLVGGRAKKDLLKKLRRFLDANIRGLVRVDGRPLLLLGGRVCQVGQELCLPKDGGAEEQAVTIRIKALEPGRLVLLLGDGGEAQEEACEEWAYAMSDFMSTKQP